MGTFSTTPAVIAEGESLSSVVDCTAANTGAGIVAIIFPSDWTSAGGVTFQVSADNIDYYDFYDRDGKEITIAAKPGGAIHIGSEVARALRYIKLRSGTKAKPVAQKADRTFQIVLVT